MFTHSQTKTAETVHYQLDPFRRNRAIFRAAPDENARKTMLKLLYRNGIEDLLSYIDALANSMKGRRRCWSVAGGNNLARLLCLKVTGKLHDAVRTCTSVMPEKYADEVITIFSSAKMQNSVGKGWDGFDKAKIPSSQKWIKSIAAIKPFSELRV